MKKVGAERKAAQTGLPPQPGRDQYDSIYVHLGAESSSMSSTWKTAYNLVVRQFVKSPVLAQAHVPDWLNLVQTQKDLSHLADARIAGAATPNERRQALIQSYMEASGEHSVLASNFVDLVTSVLVAGLQGGVKDDALSAQLQISVTALQRRFDKFDQEMTSREIPEHGWSFHMACKSNEAWLANVFSSSSKAKKRLGQAICPADETTQILPLVRNDLVDKLDRHLVGLPFGGVVAVVGDEGNGKSWLVAQTWLTWTIKPLTVFLTAEDFSEGTRSAIPLIAKKLCDQTDREGDTRHLEFWIGQLRAWRDSEASDVLRLLVVVDGINQKSKIGWARVIDLLSDELERINGKIIVTSRRRYFETLVKPSLISPSRQLAIPEWTPSERDGLLAQRGIVAGNLQPKVATSLCNPRLLAVALRLLDRAQLLALDELTIALLLFEHLRANHQESYGQPVTCFTRILQDHAKELMQRADACLEDLNVFNGGLEAVAEGRFFVPLADDSTRYSIQEEGIGLALGLAILDELRAAKRNGRDLEETLANIIEPIIALDKTAEATLSALTIACFTEELTADIGSAILNAFAGIQNLDERTFNAFAALARVKPLVFITSAEKLALQVEHAINFDWIELALQQARSNLVAWAALGPAIERWLCHVTLDVSWRASRAHDTDQNSDVRAAELRAQLDTKLHVLSASELEIYEMLIHTNAPDVSNLSRLALTLLAGMPLAPFARSLVCWGFARSLNGTFQSPIKHFRSLIRYNKIDWLSTRDALLRLSHGFQSEACTHVGKWALVTILDGTGSAEDAGQAVGISNGLRPPSPERHGLSWIERICLTDPCGPQYSEPENVSATAREYALINVGQLFQTMGQNESDRFFDKARAAIARYHPEVAIERHHALIADTLNRSGPPLRQIIVGLLEHSSLITLENADGLARLVDGVGNGAASLTSLGSDARVWTLLVLELAFPALDSERQLDILLRARLGSSLSHELIRLVKPLEADQFAKSISEALNTGDAKDQFTVLLFSPFIKQPLTESVRSNLPSLLSSASAMVRAYTLQMIVRSEDPFALQLALDIPVERGSEEEWDGELERWNFSALLLTVALEGVAPWEGNIADMELRHIARLAAHLGGDASRLFADVVEDLIKRALSLEIESESLDIEVTIGAEPSDGPRIFSVHERELHEPTFDEVMRRANEDVSEYDERQQNVHKAFLEFRASISMENANELLDQFSLQEFSSLNQIDSARLRRWCKDLLDAPDHKHLRAARNLALLMACEVSRHAPNLAVELFEKFAPIRPLVRSLFGRSGIELAEITVWSSAESDELNELRFRRLDSVTNNADLAREVWAALWVEKAEVLRKYVDAKLESEWPVAQARGIMVAGLMDESQYSVNVLGRFANLPGLLGGTQRYALELYRRHTWAVHWFRAMQNASSPEEFWRAAVLYRKVVDGRFDAITRASGPETDIFNRYWPSANRQLHNRLNKLGDEWKKRLLGEEAPPPVFV